jgi:hypothetical protein
LIPSETCIVGEKVGQTTRDEPEDARQAATHGARPAKAAVIATGTSRLQMGEWFSNSPRDYRFGRA